MFAIQELVNGIGLGAIYAVVAMSFSMIFSVTKTFHFAHGAVYMWVAYVVASLENTWLGFVGSLVCGLIVSVVLTVGLEFVIYRPLRTRGASGLTIFVASLGCMIVLSNLVLVVFGSQVRPLQIPGVSGALHLGEIVITTESLLQIGTAAVILVVLAIGLRFTFTGRSFRAVASNPEMSTLIGLDSRKRYLLAFLIGAVVLWPAAVLNAATSGVSAGLGDNIILITLIAVIVGGVESVTGAALGGLLIGLSQSLSALFVSSQWQSAVAFGVCLVFILFRPAGILGRSMLKSGS